MKNRLFVVVFAVWVAVWLFLIGRELLFKDNISSYTALFSRPLEGKRSYLTGERLYGFIGFCKASLPQRATFALTGIKDGSIERRRAVYYLYPLTESPNPDYILAYGDPAAKKDGYSTFAVSDGAGSILIRDKVRL